VGFAVFRDGTIAIADFGQRAFVLYDRAGAFQRTVRFGSDLRAAIGTLQADPRGGAVVSTGLTMVQSQAAADGPVRTVRGPAAASQEDSSPVVRYPLTANAPAREIFTGWRPPRPPAAPSRGAGDPRAVASMMGRPFEPQLYAAALPDGGVVVSDSSAYALRLIGPDGGVRRTLQRPLRPQRVTPAMERAERERRLASLTSGGVTMSDRAGGAAPSPQQMQDRMRQVVDALEFYSELPVVAGLAAGWSGKIWVTRSPANASGDGPVDVISDTGTYLGTVAPGGTRAPNAFGPDGLAAYVERDALGVVTIAVRRLPAELR
jgi:hypothetical protein